MYQYRSLSKKISDPREDRADDERPNTRVENGLGHGGNEVGDAGGGAA
jgi:hypothetical protein